MNTRDIPRTFTRDDWRKLYRIMRKVGERGETAAASLLDERAAFVSLVRKVTVDGAVCVVVSGRDCDCVEYLHSHICEGSEALPLRLWLDREDSRDWADGPVWHGYCKPEDRPRSHSRDLVMEAYENGRPHYVTSATI